MTVDDVFGLNIALENARKSFAEGGVPIGAALIYHGNDPTIPHVLGAGHNQRIQKSSSILHGETAALEAAGRLKPEIYRSSTMYTTLRYCPFLHPHFQSNDWSPQLHVDIDLNSPCSMCTGAILLYKIPRVVIGENQNFQGDEELLRRRGVDVIVLRNEECKQLMKVFIDKHPEEWYEDIGEIPS